MAKKSSSGNIPAERAAEEDGLLKAAATPSPQAPPPPRGMHAYDLGALTVEQQQQLQQFKVQTRFENEQYLRNHPEIESVLSTFLGEVLIKRPENIPEFAAAFFTNPQLKELVSSQQQQTPQQV